MNSFEQMIVKHCPNGVEYKPLGDVCKIEKGAQLNRELLSPAGAYPVINGGINPSGFWDDYNYEANKITISQGGASAGYVNWIATRFWAGAHCFVLVESGVTVLYRYIYYVVKAAEYDLMQSQLGAGIPSISAGKLAEVSIPVPPLPVQNEIVRMLDDMTGLISAIEEEIEARKKQYEWCRDKMLKLDGVERKTLGFLGGFYGGLSGKSKDDFVGGNARFISYMNVFSNASTKLDMEDYVRVSDSERQNRIQYGDVLFTGSSETREESGMSSVITQVPKEDIYLNSFCFGFRFTDKNIFEPGFLKHLLRADFIRKQIWKTASGVTRFNVSKARMAGVELPVPTLPIQKKMAAKLDDMTNLIAALEDELVARKQQYEYYRDKLLTFKWKGGGHS